MRSRFTPDIEYCCCSLALPTGRIQMEGFIFTANISLPFLKYSSQQQFPRMSRRSRLFLEESAVDEDEVTVAALWVQMTSLAVFAASKRGHGRFYLRKSRKVQHDCAGVHQHYMASYFWPGHLNRPGTTQKCPEQPSASFECRFRVSRALLDRVFSSVVLDASYV